MRNLSRLQNNLLTVGAVLGALCLLAALAGILLGAKPLVFRSGSMSPAIPTGSLGITLPVEAHEIRSNDIISIENVAGVRITHRVVTTDASAGTATVTLKGDANQVPDSERYVVSKADRLVLAVPVLGYMVAWLSSPSAMFLGGLFTAFLLYLAFGSARTKRAGKGPEDHDDSPNAEPVPAPAATPGATPKTGRRSKRMAATTIISLALVGAGALHTSTPGHAAFLDTASATTGTFTAGTLQAPTLTCTNSGTNNVRLTLTHSGDSAIAYELTTATPAKSWNSGNWSAGGSVEYIVDADDPAFTFSQTTNVTFTGLSKIGLWTSPATKAVIYTPRIVLGLVPASLRCA